MKKFILTLLALLITSTTANATYHVHYMNTGAVSHSHYGAPRPVSASFGRNAAFTPANRARLATTRRHYAHLRGEQAKCANCYNKRPVITTAASHAPVEISRFNKNYKITAQKTYTRNGITYYN